MDIMLITNIILYKSLVSTDQLAIIRKYCKTLEVVIFPQIKIHSNCEKSRRHGLWALALIFRSELDLLRSLNFLGWHSYTTIYDS